MLTKNLLISVLSALIFLAFDGTLEAFGLFGPPQTISRKSGGLNTSIGYWYHEDKFKNGSEYTFRQNEVYSQAAYGGNDRWEIYGRIGVSDLKIADVFRSTNAATIIFDNDFSENWKFFGTLGAKGFLPLGEILGIGAFVQGTYYFNNFSGDTAGTNAGVPFAADLKVRDMWNVNFGIGFQAAVPYGIKLYAGPYIYYSEAKVCLSANIPGMELGTENVLIRNTKIFGGMIGASIPLSRGFHLNVEGQYSERLSLGAAVGYAY